MGWSARGESIEREHEKSSKGSDPTGPCGTFYECGFHFEVESNQKCGSNKLTQAYMLDISLCCHF